MATLGNAVLKITGDKSGLSQTLRESESEVQGWSSRLGSVVSQGLGVALGGAIQMITGTVVSGVQNSVIGLNATLEKSTMMFTTLMGNADAAKQHVQDLFEMGKKTPFDGESFIQASQILETFGGRALDTKKNLTLLGDAASATVPPGRSMAEQLKEVTQWTSRFYLEAQEGRPITMAARRMTELGVITGEQGSKLQQMQKSGASADEMWKTLTGDMGRFTGAMDLQQHSWEGLTSTFSDSINQLIAGAFKPLFDLAESGLEQLNNLLGQPAVQEWASSVADGLQTGIKWLEDLGSRALPYVQAAWDDFVWAAQTAGQMLQEVWTIFSSIAQEAFGWGAGIAQQLGGGIMDGANEIVQAVQYIGSIITDWLMPHSPPKILPGLREWGKAVGTIYLDGMGDADLGGLKQLGGMVEDFLKGLAGRGAYDEKDIVPTVLGTRDAFSKLIENLNATGQVSTELFNKVVESAGPAGGQVKDFLNAYIDLQAASKDVADAQDKVKEATEGVTRAQQDLTDITKQYDDQLNPLQKQLDEVQAQKKKIENQQEIARLQKDAKEHSGDAARVEEDRLKIQEIQLREQMDGIKENKTAAIDEAKAKVDAAKQVEDTSKKELSAAKEKETAAKKQMELVKAQIDAQKDQNTLVKEQIDLLHKLAEEHDKAEKKGHGGGRHRAGAGGGGGRIAGEGDPVGTAVKKSVDAAINEAEAESNRRIKTLTDGIKTRIRTGLSDLQSFFQPLTDTVSRTFSGVGRLVEAEAGLWVRIIKDHGKQIFDDLLLTWNSVYTNVMPIVQNVSDFVVMTTGIIASWINAHQKEISDTFASSWLAVTKITRQTMEMLNLTIVPIIQTITDFIRSHLSDVYMIFNGTWKLVQGATKIFGDILTGTMQLIIDVLKGDWGAFGKDLADLGKKIWADMEQIFKGAIQTLNGVALLIGHGVIDTFNGIFNDSTKGMIAVGLAVVQGIQTGITRGWGELLDWVKRQAMQLVGAAKKGIESSSPSEATAREVGEPFTQGIAVGILRSMQVALDAVQTLGQALVDEMSGYAEKIGQIVQDSLHRSLSGGTDFASRRADNVKALQDLLPTQADMDQLFPETTKMGDLKKSADDIAKNLDSTKKSISDSSKKTLDDLRAQIDELDKIQTFSPEEAAEVQAQKKALQDKIALEEAAQQRLLAEAEAKAQVDLDANKKAQSDEEARRQGRIRDQKTRETQIQTEASKELQAAQSNAAILSQYDAKLGAEYYSMKSEQIFKLASLQVQLTRATTDDEKSKIQAQIEAEKELATYQNAQFSQTAKESGPADLKKLTDVRKTVADRLQGHYQTSQDLSQKIQDLETKRQTHPKDMTAEDYQNLDLYMTQAQAEIDAIAKDRDLLAQMDAQIAQMQQEPDLSQFADNGVIDMGLWGATGIGTGGAGDPSPIPQAGSGLKLPPPQSGSADSNLAPAMGGPRGTGARPGPRVNNTFYITTSAPIEPIIQDAGTMSALASMAT